MITNGMSENWVKAKLMVLFFMHLHHEYGSPI
jgi:hypothetical protein